MNAPLLALQTPPPTHNADSTASRLGRNRAEAARSLRDNRAEAAPPERFSDALQKASEHKLQEHSRPVDQDNNDDPAITNAADQPVENNTNGGDSTTSTETTSDTAGDSRVESQTTSEPAGANSESGSTTTTTTASSIQSNAQALNLETTPTVISPSATGVGQSNETANQSQAVNQQNPAQPLSQSDIPQTARSTPVAETTVAIPNTAPATADTVGGDGVQQAAVAAVRPESAQQPIRTEAVNSNTNSDAHIDARSVSSVSPQQAGQSDSQFAGDQNPQQQSTNSQSQHLRQQVQQAIAENSTVDADAQTAAERRAGQVNANVQFEQTTGAKPISIENVASSPVTTVIPGAASLDLGVQTRTTAQPVMLQAGQPVDEAAATGNVVRGLSALVNQRGGVMHMRLDPPELGQLRVQMNIQQGSVTAQFQAATAQAQTILERNIATLRTALERHGLTVERLTVQVHQPSQGQQTTGQNLGDQLAEQSQQDSQHNAGGNASRGRGEHASSDQQQQSFAQFAHDELNNTSYSEQHTIEAGAS